MWFGSAEERDLDHPAAGHPLPAVAGDREAAADREARGQARPARPRRSNGSTFSGGGAQTDALLSGSVDVVNTGIGNLLLLWDRTKGGVKGIVATSAQPLTLISRNPKIKTLKDFGAERQDRGADGRVSTQAILLQMACGKTFGAGPVEQARRQHRAARPSRRRRSLANPRGEVKSHFAAPPFSTYELKNVKGAHIVLHSPDIIGGPLTQSQFFTTTKFADAEPEGHRGDQGSAARGRSTSSGRTRRQPSRSISEMTKDKTSSEDMLDMLKQPGMME